MVWALVAAGLFLAAFMGAALASLLTTIRPEWPRRRRLLTAATVLPAITLVAGLCVALLGAVTADSSMRSAIFLIVLIWSAAFAGLGFAGGLIGAMMSFSARRG
jgi:hypothetical protein